MEDYTIHQFPRARIATIDAGAAGNRKHRVYAMLEVDVTASRRKIRDYRKRKGQVSFTAWLVKVISHSIGEHEKVSAFRAGKRKVIVFKDINISLAIEKDLNGEKVVFPLLLEKVNAMSLETITHRIKESKQEESDDKTMVLQRKTAALEKLYYRFPGFIRKAFWKYLLKHPQLAHKKMGNVAITSLSMIGNRSGWFIPVSVHPICFGIGAVTQKPVVLNQEIVVREILHFTLMADHDVVDGAPLARFVRNLTDHIENGLFL